ncbi:MAG: DNA-binding protein, partial [Neisseriaceae bacterium]|nr:DNA-binding protein [Neisseriaceae bacterium]
SWLLTLILPLVATYTFADQVLLGKNWSAKEIDGVYVVSIKDRANLVEALTDFVTTNKITAGQIQGLGAINSVTLKMFNPTTQKFSSKTFNKQLEMTNVTGNIFTMDHKPNLHLHVTLGDENYQAIAGHLLEAKIRGAGEFYVTPVKGIVEKTPSKEVGLNLYDFQKK